MKLPSIKDVDYKKIIALAILVLVLAGAAMLLADRFSTIEVLGVKLEAKTEAKTEETTPAVKPTVTPRSTTPSYRTPDRRVPSRARTRTTRETPERP